MSKRKETDEQRIDRQIDKQVAEFRKLNVLAFVLVGILSDMEK